MAITERARELCFRAIERGWHGPPFNPFALAEIIGIETVPSGDVLDARLVPAGAGRCRIEYNPDRPRRRVRFSLFHEIAHTLFPDHVERVRHRSLHTGMGDEWQVEALCNIAAAEMLLPAGELADCRAEPSIDAVLDVRDRFDASAESALLRLARLTGAPAVAFACHAESPGQRYRVEYSLATASSGGRLPAGSILPPDTVVSECATVGYTAKGTEKWPHLGEVRVECAGVAALRGQAIPRVVGFARPTVPAGPAGRNITYLRGDATRPRGSGEKMLLQVVNDKAHSWGARGFAGAVRTRWPAAQEAFTAAVKAGPKELRLGAVFPFRVASDLTLVSLVAQHGYGPSPAPRIRYVALLQCLRQASTLAKEHQAAVHMPRLGAGQAGGAWPIVAEMVREVFCRHDINVHVYDPPGTDAPKAQGDLPFPVGGACRGL